MIVSETESVDAKTGELLFARARRRSSAAPAASAATAVLRSGNEPPSRKPDHEVSYKTPPEQALHVSLERRSQSAAQRSGVREHGGLPRPILHGLCTYGFTGRALLHTLCGSDPARFKSMEGRFSKPVFPGETLTIAMWVDGTTCLFQTKNERGEVVLDQGKMTFA